jgi:hypothetical protein
VELWIYARPLKGRSPRPAVNLQNVCVWRSAADFRVVRGVATRLQVGHAERGGIADRIELSGDAAEIALRRETASHAWSRPLRRTHQPAGCVGSQGTKQTGYPLGGPVFKAKWQASVWPALARPSAPHYPGCNRRSEPYKPNPLRFGVRLELLLRCIGDQNAGVAMV